MIHAQEVKFEVFNNLNSTDEFDISCGYYTPMGTKIKKWGCGVEYMRRARAESVKEWKDNGGLGMPADDHELTVMLGHKTRALNKEMRVLAATYPELAVAIINAHELEELYKAERRRRFKGSISAGNPEKPDLKLNKIMILEAAFKDHRNGVISDSAWERWDNMYKKIFRISAYRNMWKKADHKNYESDFVEYVNSIMPGR